MKKLLPIMASSALLLLTACAGFEVQKDKMQQVQRVAVVGLDVTQQQQVSATDLLKVATHVKDPRGPGVGTREEAAHVTEIYEALTAKLGSEAGWKVMSRQALIANPAYAKLFKDKTEGWQNRPLVPERYTMMQANGILDSFAIRTMKSEELRALQEALKVDAIITVASVVRLNLDSRWATLVGQGEFSPSSSTSITMTDARTGDVIWKDSNVEGDKIKAGEKTFLGMAADEKINRLSVEATKSSYGVLFDHLLHAR